MFYRTFSKPKGKLLALGLTVVLLGLSAEVFSQPIKLGYAALSAAQVAAWMAKEGGYLSKYGIEAELIYIPATTATQALISGEIQLAQVTGVSTAGAIVSGADVKIVASSLNRPVGFIYARPEIKSPEQLKGKKLGILRFGALSDTAAAIFLERYGLKRGTDVAIIQLGGLPEIITAMERGPSKPDLLLLPIRVAPSGSACGSFSISMRSAWICNRLVLPLLPDTCASGGCW